MGTTSYSEYNSDPRPTGVEWTYKTSRNEWPHTAHDYGNDESIGWEFDLTPNYGRFKWVEYDPVMLLGEYVEDTADLDLDQESVFNALTNNGESQGLYLYNGKVYLNGEYLGAGAISIGGSNYSAKPSLTIKDANNNVIGSWSKDGITWNTANSTMTANGTLTASNVVMNGTVQTDYTYTSGGVTHTRTAKLTGGDLNFLFDNAQKFNISAKNAGTSLTSSKDIDVFCQDFTVDASSSFTLQTENQEQYIGVVGDSLEINNVNGTVSIRCDTLTIGDDSSGSDGYTGTKNGIRFVHGICVG